MAPELETQAEYWRAKYEIEHRRVQNNHDYYQREIKNRNALIVILMLTSLAGIGLALTPVVRFAGGW